MPLTLPRPPGQRHGRRSVIRTLPASTTSRALPSIPRRATDEGVRKLHRAGEARALRVRRELPRRTGRSRPSAIFPGVSSCARSPTVPSTRPEKPSCRLQDPAPATSSERAAPRKVVTETLPRSSDAAASKTISSPGQESSANLVDQAAAARCPGADAGALPVQSTREPAHPGGEPARRGRQPRRIDGARLGVDPVARRAAREVGLAGEGHLALPDRQAQPRPGETTAAPGDLAPSLRPAAVRRRRDHERPATRPAPARARSP